MLKKIFAIIVALGLTIPIAEFSLRFLGFETYHYKELDDFSCNPNHWTPDPYLGFCHLPGNYSCYITNNDNSRKSKDSIKFSVHHISDSSRATSKNGYNNIEYNNLHLYGGSVTWGHGIDDTSTMGWIMQEMLDSSELRNYGLAGGSIVQSYLWLKRNVNKGNKPDIAIINYSSYLDMRTALTWPWRKVWQSTFHKIPDSISANDIQFPYARIKDNNIRVDYMNLNEINFNLPLIHSSVLMNIANESYQMLSEYHVDERKATTLLLIEIHKYCHRNDIKLVVNAITHDKHTNKTLSSLAKKGIWTNKLSSNFWAENTFNLKPVDAHPNALANQLLAYKLLTYLYAYGLT